MLRPGINENAYITKIEMTEKGALVVSLDESGSTDDTSAEPMDDFEALQEEGYTPESSLGINIMIFGFNTKKNDGTLLTAKQIGEEIKSKKNLFLHILSAYKAVSQEKFDLYANTGITDVTSYNAGITNEGILKQIFKNLCEQFIIKMQPYIDAKIPVRILLLRRSATVHFATFRQKFLQENPMIEPANIPLAQSKLKFTQYELDNKLNDPTPVTKTQADKPGQSSVPSAEEIAEMPMPEDLPFSDGQMI